MRALPALPFLMVLAIWNRKIRQQISNVTFEDVRDCFVPSLLINLHNYTLLFVFNGGDLAAFSLIKRMGPCILLLMMVCHRALRLEINSYKIPGAVLMVIGALVGKQGMIPPVGLVAVSAKCLYSITLMSQCHNKSPWMVNYLISWFSIITELFMVLIFNEHNRLYDGYSAHTIEFWRPELWLGIAGFVAIAIVCKISTTAISKYVKPLAVSVIDDFQSTTLAILGMFIFDGVVDRFMISGVTVSCTGAYIYTALVHAYNKPKPAEEDCEQSSKQVNAESGE